MKKITEFQIKISPQNVCAMLDADRSSLEEEMREELEEMLPEAYERLEPAAFLGFGDTEGFLCGEDELSGQEALYIICTVGDALSRWSSELFAQGDCLRAMLADAAADDCLFQMDEQLKDRVTALCRERGKGIRRRLEAPHDVPMSIQKKALDVTGASEGGIGITEGFMYRPVKSVCQVYLLSDDTTQCNYEHDCSRCPNTSCRLRKIPGRSPKTAPKTAPEKAQETFAETEAEMISAASPGPTVTTVSKEGRRKLRSAKGRSILETLRENGIYISALCSGRGTCGKCRIQVAEGEITVSEEDRRFFTPEELEKGFRLACAAYPADDCTVHIAAGAGEQEFYIPAGPAEGAQEQPDLSENPAVSPARTAGRTWDEKKKSAGGTGGKGEKLPAEYDAAVDIGTTTVAMQLIDPVNGGAVKTYTALNSQRMYGADVIGRIEAAGKGKAGDLQECIRRVLREGMDSLTDSGRRPVRRMMIGANTTMVHLLMGYPCESLGIYPFLPYNIKRIETSWTEVTGQADRDFPVSICPGISTYVGGDITAGLYALDFHKREKVSVLIDLGTNGEMAVGNRERILAASAAAGPAFEGGNIVCGTGSVPGAVCHAEWKDGRLCVETISGKEPSGICGTGIIEILYCLLEAEIMDETGRLEAPWDSEGFPVDEKGNIRIYQKDIREIQLAKAAVRAGLETLLAEYGITAPDVEEICLAGGFGYEMDVRKASGIGLLPSGCEDKVRAVGNTCLRGAAAGLRDENGAETMDHIARMVTEISLSGNPRFGQFYMEYMCFEGEET